MASTDPRRPNILLVVSDDQGPWALGCAGNREILTPTLDALAASGTRFDRFYCSSPVCSPARASLLTGRMPSAHGVHDWIRGEAYGTADEAEYLAGLTTIPTVLADAGWTCGYSGKWHLGTSRLPAPGFDFWYAHRTGDGPYFGAPVWKNRRRISEQRYITHAITDEALSFLEREAATGAPYFLAVGFTAPHSPWVEQHPRQYIAPYDDCTFSSCPQEAPDPWFSWEPGPITEAMRDPGPSLRGYFASVTAMDEDIGRLVAFVDEAGQREATVLVFLSDNGFSCGQRGIWGKGNATWPLNLWENSVRVPAIFSQPGRIRSGAVRHDLASACDIHPTLLELSGVPPPADPVAAGVSLAPALTRGTPPARQALFVFDEYGAARAVRAGDWKYVTRADNGPSELYDLHEDPDERVNLVADRAYRGRAHELEAVLRDWFRQHSLPERDGFNRPVSGRGQVSPLFEQAGDEATYYRGSNERRGSR